MAGDPCNKYPETLQRVAICEESTKSAHHRIDGIAKQTEAVVQLGLEVKHLAEVITTNILPQLVDHNDRLGAVEQRPANTALKYWRMAIGAVITSCVAGIVGFAIGQMV